MPQLPGGRHIAVKADSLFALCDDAQRGFRVHELMSIESSEQLMNYIDVIFFKAAGTDYKQPQTARGSNAPPEGLVPYRSGYTVISIQDKLGEWIKEDRAAFLDFISDPRTQEYFNQLLIELEKYKQRLFKHGNLVTRIQIGWWKTGCHPLQPDVWEEETGINERKRHN